MRNGQSTETAGPSFSGTAFSDEHTKLSNSRRERKAKTKKSASDSRMDSTAMAESSFQSADLGALSYPPDGGDGTEEVQLKYGAAHVINLFVPVSLCMAVVILTMTTIGYFSQDDGVYLLYTPFTKKTDDTSQIIMMSIGNALIMLAIVVIMSIVLILLYKFRFYRVIHAWLIVSSTVLLSLFTAMYLSEVFQNWNVSVDYLSFMFFIWNYACLGLICVHWKGPLLLQQFYLIIMSALMALIFIKFMPEWTVWAVLAVLSVWDLIAVLCPKGPLRILVEMAQERNEPIFPALIYSSGVLYFYIMMTMHDTSAEPLATDAEADGGEECGRSATLAIVPPSGSSPSTSASTGPSAAVISAPSAVAPNEAVRYAPLRSNRNANDRRTSSNSAVSRRNVTDGPTRKHEAAPPSHRRSQSATIPQTPANSDVEERGVKLGLGDFIFYSVLVGKASSFGDWNTTVACYVAILVGLAFTLMLLALFRKALPALPISIFLGIVFFFASRNLMSPFISELSLRRYVL